MIVINNYYFTFTPSLNICNSPQFLLAQVYPFSGCPFKISAESEVQIEIAPFPAEVLFSLRNTWLHSVVLSPPTHTLIVKHKTYAKYLKICSGLWFVFMNGFYSSGQLLEAAEHYEAFHQLTQGRIWKDETGRVLNLLACESLLRTYRLLSDKMLENKEYKQAIRILIKASEIAKEGGWKRALSRCCL